MELFVALRLTIVKLVAWTPIFISDGILSCFLQFNKYNRILLKFGIVTVSSMTESFS